MIRRTPTLAFKRTSRTNTSRRGAAYLMVIGVTMIVGVLAYSNLHLARIQGRQSNASNDALIARQCAQDGIAAARERIDNDTNWRNNVPNGLWIDNQTCGAGSFSIEVSDPVDGNVALGQFDPIVLKSTGVRGLSRSALRVTLQAKPVPHASLAYPLHVVGKLNVSSSQTLKANGGPVSSDNALVNGGTIAGGIHVKKVTTMGLVLGTPIVTNAAAKGIPAASVINNYAALGTTISAPSTIENAVLAPGYNSLGTGTDSGGVYVIRPTGDLTIKNSRFYGTLVIICSGPGSVVTIDDRILFHSPRADYPTLLISGDADFRFLSDSTTLSEANAGMNFNPPGAPYGGAANLTNLDTYPSEIQGLVHITRTLTMSQSARVRGVLLVDEGGPAPFTVSGAPELIYTPTLFQNPPQWYTSKVPMPILPGSWTSAMP